MSRRARTAMVTSLFVILAVPARARSEPGGGAPAPTGTGVLQGHLYGVGGPPPGLHEAWAGTVTIIGPRLKREITVAPDGAYSVALVPGRYTVAGHSPRFNDGKKACQGAEAARVAAGRVVTVDVLCTMR